MEEIETIKIEETSPFLGIPAEYSWIAKKYPGYKMIRQSLQFDQDSDSKYDIITFLFEEKEHSVRFDITDFFGKF